ncbi:MAG: anthranilate phosphoribosyltransferase [Bacteroidota bacterium]
MKDLLNHLFEHNTLTKAEAKKVLQDIAAGGNYPPAQVSAFLTVFNMRSITVEELSGFREAMLELCIALDLAEFDPIDLCGTGGDGKDTFNISTLSSFVAAGAGVKVTKHGNYGVSSVSGSSNMIEYFGYTFTNDPDALKRSLEDYNICFIHAPLFHPAMKHVAPIRRELKLKTFFNMLGPMVNPAFPRRQLVGVFSLELARLYGYIYQKTDKEFAIVHALDGYDEVSLTGPAKIIRRGGEQVVLPEELTLSSHTPEALFGGNSVPEAAAIFEKVLKNEGTLAQKEVVLANAGLAIQCARPELGMADAVAAARVSLESGKANETFKGFVGQ